MYVAAAETCELPITPMGRWLTCLNRLSSIRDMYVPATPAKLHRPYGKLTFCSLLAGRWCRSLWRHSDHLFVHHQWEYSFFCARSSSKVPNAPMGKMLMCLPRLTLAQLRTIRSTAVGECCRDLENFPSPDGNALLTCNSILAVQMGSNLVLPGMGTCQPCLPIAPMQDSRFDPCLQGGSIFVDSGTVTITASSITASSITGNTAVGVRAHVQKFPWSPCETHVLLVVCRAVVLLSTEAQCQS